MYLCISGFSRILKWFVVTVSNDQILFCSFHCLYDAEIFLKVRSDVRLSYVVSMRFLFVVCFCCCFKSHCINCNVPKNLFRLGFDCRVPKEPKFISLILWYEHICCFCIHKIYSIFAKWMSVWPFQMKQ